MGIPFIIYTIVGVALAALAGLMTKKKPKTGLSQDEPTTLATRGEYVNYVIGTQKTGFLFAYAWGRRGKSSKTLGQVYREWGWHAIGLGPAISLWQITAGGEVIWQGPIHSYNTPSGTAFNVLIPNTHNRYATFRIYWGERNQPIDTELSAALPDNITSQWPNLFYIVWTGFPMGGSPVWPQIEYVWTAGCSQSQLTESNMIIGGYPDTWPQGINHAHVLYQLLTAPSPWGAGIPASNVDRYSLELMGRIMEREGIAMNATLQSGEDVAKSIDSILLDTGTAMIQQGDKLSFIVQRPPDIYEPVPDLSDDFVAPPDVTRIVSRSEKAVNFPTFTFADQNGFNFDFRVNDVALSNDASINDYGSVKAQRVNMDTISHAEHAVIVAARREQETMLQSSISFNALHAVRMMFPGMMFTRNGDRYRITSLKPSFISPVVEVKATLDAYGVEQVQVPLPPQAGDTVSTPMPDLFFSVVQLNNNPLTVGVFRIRAFQQIQGAVIVANEQSQPYFEQGVWVLGDDGNQDAAAGGILTEDLLSGVVGPVDFGPKFESVNQDTIDVADLTGDDLSWQSGSQLALIGKEIFYLKTIDLMPENVWTASTAYNYGDFVVGTGAFTGLRFKCTTTGTTDSVEPKWPTKDTDMAAIVPDGTVTWEVHGREYQTRGLIRAQHGTAIADHYANDWIAIINHDDLQEFTDIRFSDKMGLCVKSIPYIGINQVDSSLVSPDCITLSV